MPTVQNLKAPFYRSPEWKSCGEITASGPLLEVEGQTWTHERGVTWGDYPYRYVLTEFLRQKSAYIIGTKLVPRMYELSRLSAMRADTGMVNLSRYYIGKSGLHAVFHHEVAHWDCITPEAIKEYEDASLFMREHGLYAPAAEDGLELNAALHHAQLDGVDPYTPRRND